MSHQDPRRAGTPYKTTCGGQALIEGIMMQGPEQRAVVVRKPDGTLDITTTPVKKRRGLAALPFVRGVFVFCSSMVNGVKALMHSAEVSDDGAGGEEELTGLDKWIADHFPKEKAASLIVTLAAVLGIAFPWVCSSCCPRRSPASSACSGRGCPCGSGRCWRGF